MTTHSRTTIADQLARIPEHVRHIFRRNMKRLPENERLGYLNFVLNRPL
jgi:hypothetical protein